MSSVREIDIKKHTYYFFNDMMNIKNIDLNDIETEIMHIKKYAFTTLAM